MMVAALILSAPTVAVAADGCANAVGQVVSAEGRVEVLRAAGEEWHLAWLGEPVCAGDRVRAGSRSRAAVSLGDNGVIRVDANSNVRIVRARGEQSLLDLVRGAVQFFSRQPISLEVTTPYLNAGVRGTEFLVRVDSDSTLVAVYEGVVQTTNAAGELSVSSGEAAVARAGEAPSGVVLVEPRDAVQWTLYYPPILSGVGGEFGEPATSLSEPLARAARLSSRGEVMVAFDALEAVPEPDRDSQFYLYRAALLLSVGRVEAARGDIDRSLRLDPGAGVAYGLRAVIAVAQNRKDEALADGRQAVELSDRSAAAAIALSYALQANFQLEQAKDVMLRAVEENPQDPLARARLAELWLTLGYREKATEAAREAVALSPDTARAQTMLGFAALSELNISEASTAFQRAIELEPGGPLPRLGLGLAEIRQSDLEDGRKNLEIAVALDPGNSVMRSYLGRAYFAEKREVLASDQYSMAKTLDPLDPTAYFYDGILKQTENRPVEALEEVQRAMKLNDERLVYRGQLLLDEDEAARGAALARVYDDLGFERLGELQAADSLGTDPASAAAHRFLADTYRSATRLEVARASELLQSQLLQDINIYPIQPSFADTNLNIITRGGPVTGGINEFTPVFRRNEVALFATGQVGNFDTLSGEAVVSAVYDQFSLSAGQFHFQTDGFRENNDNDVDVTDLFAQVALTPDFSLQAEYIRQRTDQGDLIMDFDPDVFNPNYRRKMDRDLGRVGGRYSFGPGSDLLFSVMYADLDVKIDDPGVFRQDFPAVFFFGIQISPPFTVTGDLYSELDDKGWLGEAQYILQRSVSDQVSLDVITGFGVARVNSKQQATLSFFRNGVFVSEETSFLDLDIDQENFYFYSKIHYKDDVTLTLGASFDRYEDEQLTRQVINPKLGLEWTPLDRVTFRAFAARDMAAPAPLDRRIAPTEIAGFNQLYDDPGGTLSFRYGVGVDVNVTDALFAGMEASRRSYQLPIRDANQARIDDRTEDVLRGYLYWALGERWAVRAEGVLDTFETDDGLSTIAPDEVQTVSVPVGLGYFHPWGLFGEVVTTYVHQDVDRSFAGPTSGSSDFTTVDAAIGYRLPRRLGVASFQVRNLFDRQFNYLDDNYRQFGETVPYISPYVPERTFAFTLSLSL